MQILFKEKFGSTKESSVVFCVVVQKVYSMSYLAILLTLCCYSLHVTADISKYMQSLNGSNARVNEKFIQTNFVSFGLDTWLEEVNYQNGKGGNVIGVLWGKKMLAGVSSGSKFYMVASSYASSHNDRSGVAVMLDVAEKLSKGSKLCDREQTIVFVAFDENEEASQQYLKNLSSFSRTYNFASGRNFSYEDIYGKIAGGVTLDELSKYDTKNNTQRLPAAYVDYSTDLKQRLQQGDYKGDFVLAVGGTTEKTLLNQFKASFLTTGVSEMYSISLQLPDNLLNTSSIQKSFRSFGTTMIALSDTKQNRNTTLPLKQENFSFMNSTSAALHMMLAKLSIQKCYSLDKDALSIYEIMKNFNKPRFTNADKSETRIYIENTFKSSGLKIIKQKYQHGSNHGLNIAGVLEGREDKHKVYIIASHYDSQMYTHGFDDSGSGIAIVIRVAQRLANKAFKYSIMLIAFDEEELELAGSHIFVPNYLTSAGNPISGKYEVLGSWILDCAMNYNDQPHTQSLPHGVDKVFPDAIKLLKSHNYTGTTMAVIGREDDASSVKSGATQLMTSGGVSPMEFNLPIKGNPDKLDRVTKYAFANFFRSDHTSFWRNNITSVFLTDTSEFRGVMKHCYHRWCDNAVQFSPKSYTFANGISTGLASLVQEKAEEVISASKMTSMSAVSIITMGLLLTYWNNLY